jgi:hypothetical protein
MNALIQRFRALPRSGKWLAGFAVFLAVYFIAIEPLATLYGAVRIQAEQNRAKLLEAGARVDRRGQEQQRIVLGSSRYGSVSPPGPEQRIAGELDLTIARVLDAHGITSPTITTRRSSPLGPGPLQDEFGEAARIERVVKVIEFEASPERAAGVLGDLEASPAVVGVPFAQLRRTGGRAGQAGERVVRAEFRVEAWVLREGPR